MTWLQGRGKRTDEAASPHPVCLQNTGCLPGLIIEIIHKKESLFIGLKGKSLGVIVVWSMGHTECRKGVNTSPPVGKDVRQGWIFLIPVS